MSASADESLPAKRLFTNEEFSSITSFDDALNLLKSHGATPIDSADLGDGFQVLDSAEKTRLIGVPFIVMSAVQSEGENGTFVSLRCVTKTGEKLVINDGGTGICEQILTLWEKEPDTKGKPIFARNGLRVSEYTHPQFGRSKTFYLDTSGK